MPAESGPSAEALAPVREASAGPRAREPLAARSLVDGLLACLRIAPLGLGAFFVVVSLRSSAIFDENAYAFNRQLPWHPDFVGWHDAVLVLGVLLTFVGGRIRPTQTALRVTLVFGFIILLSLAPPGEFGAAPVFAALVHYLRFAATFLLANALVTALGIEAVEAAVFTVMLLLLVSGIFVASFDTGTHQLYFSGMSIGSSGQLAAVTSLIALRRRRLVLLVVAAMATLLTLSRTAILVFAAIALVHTATSRTLTRGTRLLIGLVLGGTFLVCFYIVNNLAYFSGILDNRLDPNNIMTLAFRTHVWDYALYAFQTRHLPLLGLGFNLAPSWIIGAHFQTETGIDYYPPSFHSIIIEYAFGLGVLSVVVFHYILRRTRLTFKWACYPACHIYAYFLLAQSIDFNVYKPKEVLIWGFLLGMAEGQYGWASQASAPAEPARESAGGPRG